MAKHLLHGTLRMNIYEVDKVSTGRGLLNLFAKGPQGVGSKLYITLDLDGVRVWRTWMIETQSNPWWYDQLKIYCAHTVSEIVLTLKKYNKDCTTVIGKACLPVEEFLQNRFQNKWIQIDQGCNLIRKNSRIRVEFQFYPVSSNENWSLGIKSLSFEGVRPACFKQRDRCKVTLYQDAHISTSVIPEFILSSGQAYGPQGCLEDVYDAIANAKHLIYIAGWTINVKMALARDKRPRPQGDITLAELLIQKAKQGVAVIMLVWDDRTTMDLFKKDGLMSTHAQETADYFHNTEVDCYLCPRYPGSKKSYKKGFEVSAMFTHHQKMLAVDSKPEYSGEFWQLERRIVSFLGGIDLCYGKYDTPDHSLIRTPNTIHIEDFHQPNFMGVSVEKGGPREPWHDIHCKLEGPVSWDVFYSFVYVVNKLKGYECIGLDMNVSEPKPVTHSKDPNTWKVQIFRSIDSRATDGFSDLWRYRRGKGVVNRKDNVIDRSIHDAYIHAIRRARNYIYIESQYFIGSSYGWKSDDIRDADVGALNLIPKELSLKIVSKIEAGERFTVYVVIPMWPGGIPESESVQEILDWQRRTMEMMYKDIAEAIQAKGLNAHGRDYLTFFCLGNRKIEEEGEYKPLDNSEPGSSYSRVQLARRFMIRVHAKMMIVDDEYIITGSANINQRSMDGARDTEIAMGAFQPYQLATDQPARGQIYGFRMSLWYKHLLQAGEKFLHPESLECVREVNKLSDRNWDLYTSEAYNEDLSGNLLRYPISISENGTIFSLPGFEFFPDTNARVLGNKAKSLPPILTT